MTSPRFIFMFPHLLLVAVAISLLPQRVLAQSEEEPPTHPLTVDNGSGDGEYYPGEEVVITAPASLNGASFLMWKTVGPARITPADPYSRTTTVHAGHEPGRITAIYGHIDVWCPDLKNPDPTPSESFEYHGLSLPKPVPPAQPVRREIKVRIRLELGGAAASNKIFKQLYCKFRWFPDDESINFWHSKHLKLFDKKTGGTEYSQTEPRNTTLYFDSDYTAVNAFTRVKSIWYEGDWTQEDLHTSSSFPTPKKPPKFLLSASLRIQGYPYSYSNGGHKESIVHLLPVEFVPDYNRDGKIDSADRGQVSNDNPFRWWINDDNDLTSAERGNNLQDIPKQSTSDRDCNDLAVDGMRDLIDFFPLHLDLKQALEVLPADDYKYVLKHEEEALKFFEYPACIIDGSDEGHAPNRHIKLVAAGRGLASKELKLASTTGSELSSDMLSNLKDGKGVMLIEGAKKTGKPLVLEILKKSDNSSVAEIKFPIQIVDVEDMYRHVNLRGLTGGSGGHTTQTGEPTGYPDDLTNGKYVAYIHGYNVSGESCRGSQSNIFKRLYQLGSKARFIGVSWYGDPPNPGINLVLPPDYHRAVYNGLVTGAALNAHLGFTQGSGLTVLAHSLGNSVAGNAIANHGLQVDQYYIINGAIALQAYDSSQTTNSSGHPDMKRNMTEDDWKPFYDFGQQRLFAANWHELFADTPADRRNQLTWKDVFAKPELLSVAYNFYSPSDEVVENADSTEEFGDWGNLWDSAHGGRHAWVQQEIAKGGQHAVAGAAFYDLNGGWQFNGAWDIFEWHGNSGSNRRRTPSEAASLTDAQLKSEPFHRRFWYDNLYDPAQGSASAGVDANRFKLLATGIPATSYAIAVNSLDRLGNATNFNMPSQFMSSGVNTSWPVHPKSKEDLDWMHSDFKDVALHFLHPMYQKMIDLAELDKD